MPRTGGKHPAARTRYSGGTFPTREEANEAIQQLRTAGFDEGLIDISTTQRLGLVSQSDELGLGRIPLTVQCDDRMDEAAAILESCGASLEPLTAAFSDSKLGYHDDLCNERVITTKDLEHREDHVEVEDDWRMGLDEEWLEADDAGEATARE